MSCENSENLRAKNHGTVVLLELRFFIILKVMVVGGLQYFQP